MTRDRLDHIFSQWQQEAPDLDISALAVVGRVLRIARLLEKHREQVLAEYGLNVWSFDVLTTLRRQGPPYQLKPTELYQVLMLSSGATTHRIDRLEADGIVTRSPDPSDRRGVIVQLTPKGMDLSNRVLPILFQREQHLLAELTHTETDQFVQLLRKLLVSLDDSPEPE